MASGEGVAIESVWPPRSAAVRVAAAGSGNSTSLSSLGTRLGSQYSLKGTSSARVCGTKAASFHGPVPDGAWANLFQSRPTFSHRAGLELITQPIWSGRTPPGPVIGNPSVDASATRET